jgi:hypothetical protein
MTKGLRSAIVFVEGDWCYAKLRFEVFGIKIRKKIYFYDQFDFKRAASTEFKGSQ